MGHQKGTAPDEPPTTAVRREVKVGLDQRRGTDTGPEPRTAHPDLGHDAIRMS